MTYAEERLDSAIRSVQSGLGRYHNVSAAVPIPEHTGYSLKFGKHPKGIGQWLILKTPSEELFLDSAPLDMKVAASCLFEPLQAALEEAVLKLAPVIEAEQKASAFAWHLENTDPLNNRRGGKCLT